MKQEKWWVPDAADKDSPRGSLLSRRWVQSFVFELPTLKPSELESSLRYKVQATLPVNTEDYLFHTQLFRQGKKMYGVAFVASPAAVQVLPEDDRSLRVAVPLVLPKGLPANALLWITTPDGLTAHLYDEGVLKTSFAPMGPQDEALRRRIIDQHPGVEIVALSPDQDFPLPPDLQEKETAEALRAKLLDSFPFWKPTPASRLPLVAAGLFLAAGLILCALALSQAWTVREQRNEAWRAWLKTTEAATATPSFQQQTAKLLKAQGLPVPELFSHLAQAWGNQTRILDLEWAEGKLTLTAQSSSALTSLKKLTADAWFRNIRVDDIRTQKDGSEVFTIEGGLNLDS